MRELRSFCGSLTIKIVFILNFYAKIDILYNLLKKAGV